MEYVYSAINNAFFPKNAVKTYNAAGWVLTDAIDVPLGTYIEFKDNPAGKIRIAGWNGLPAWIDQPAPTRDEQVQLAAQQRIKCLSYADEVTADWRTELALGEISDTDKVKLTAWMAYKRDVKSVNVDEAITQNFSWPEQPAP